MQSRNCYESSKLTADDICSIPHGTHSTQYTSQVVLIKKAYSHEIIKIHIRFRYCRESNFSVKLLVWESCSVWTDIAGTLN